VSVAAPLVQIGLLGEAIDGAPVAVFVTDDAGRYLAANRCACDLLGYSREELLGLSVRDLAVGSDVEAHLQRLLTTREDRGVTELRRKDGTTARLRYRAGHSTLAQIPCFVAVGVEAEPGD
jgi:PAS domain S-box-containing protein